MNNILFDLWTAQPTPNSKFHGGGEYIKSVFKHLVTNYSSELKISVYYDDSLFLDDWILELIQVHNLQTYNIKNFDSLQSLISNNIPNIFFSGLPYFYGHLQIPSQTYFLGTVHGLRIIEIPCDQFAYKYFKFPQSIKELIKSKIGKNLQKKQIRNYQTCLNNLDSIICVSNHTKYAIKNFFPELKKQVNCFYTPPKAVSCKAIEHTDIASKFILLIATNRFEKNSYRAIKALDNLF